MSQLVELCTGQGNIEVLRAGSISGDVREVDVGGGHAGQLDLRLLGSLTQTLHCDLIGAQVDAFGLLELVNEVLGDACVEVVAAQTVVARGGQNFDDAVADLQHGHVEGAAAEVVDHDLLIGLFLIQTVGQSSRGRLVDYTLDVETCDAACVLGRLTLCVSEVCGDGDDGIGHGLAEVSLSVGLQLLQNHCGNLLRGVCLVVYIHLVIGAHLALDGGDGAIGVGDGLTLCYLADHTLAGLCECNDGRSCTCAFSVGDDYCLAAFHNGNTAVSSTEVYANDFTHN